MPKMILLDSRIKKYAYREVSEIYRDLGSSPDGLSREQVQAMRERYGSNRFTGQRTDTTMHCVRRAFINPFHVILFVLGIVSLVTDVFLGFHVSGNATTAVIIFSMILISGAAFINPFHVILFVLGIVSLVTDVFLGFHVSGNATTAVIIFSMILISGAIRLIQELRAKHAANQLERLIEERVTVKRDGGLVEIPAEELVVGDLILLSAGDRVPADIRLTKVSDLFISQAAITGESAILEKSCRTLRCGEEETLTQLENLSFMATTVISGKGEGIVLAVGKDTLYCGFVKSDADENHSFYKGANSIAWVRRCWCPLCSCSWAFREGNGWNRLCFPCPWRSA